MKKIILLGHSGFIGHHLEKAFEGKYQGTKIIGKSLPAVDLTKSEDVDRLTELFDPETAVIMCAAVKRQFGDTLEAFKNNLNMTINLCRILSQKPVKRFVFFSSAAVYGEDIHNTSITEQTPVNPTSYYGAAKFSAECLYRKAGELKDSLVIIRPPLIYGPGDMGKTYGPVGFIKAALSRESITLWGDGTELREFIFVEDIVRIVCILLTSDFNGVVNVASGRSYSFKEVFKEVSDLKYPSLSASSIATRLTSGKSSPSLKSRAPSRKCIPVQQCRGREAREEWLILPQWLRG